MKQHATNIVRELRNRGFQAYFAGGCVRDMLLGVEPRRLRRCHRCHAPAGDAHLSGNLRRRREVRGGAGAVDVPPAKKVGSRPIRIPTQATEASADAPPALPSEHPNYVEVATFRNDGTYSDGRHPDQVSYAKDPQEDVQRRDFTINGLLMDPLDGNRVLDFVGGRTTCGPEWSAPSAIRNAASAKTSCACCGRYALRPASTTSSIRQRLRQFSGSRRRFIK